LWFVTIDMGEKSLKILKIAAVSALLFFLFLVVALFVVGYIWEDKINEAVIASINHEIEEEITIGAIDFSLFRGFPYATVVLNDVKVECSRDLLKHQFKVKSDNFLKAGTLYLEFNLPGLIQGNYLLKQLYIHNGQLMILYDEKGNSSFQYWDDKDSTSSEFSIDLSKVSFKNTELIYVEKAQKVNLHAHMHEVSLSGNLNDKSYQLDTEAIVWLGNLELNKEEIISRRPIRFNIDFLVTDEQFEIKRGILVTAGMEFETSGFYRLSDNYIDFGVKGKDLDIVSFISVLPEKVRDEVGVVESSGNFYLDGTIKGKLAAVQNPLLEVNFGFHKATIKDKERALSLHSMNCKGSFTNGDERTSESSVLRLSDLNFKIEKESSFSGSLILSNLKNKQLDVKLNFLTQLDELSDYLSSLSIVEASGSLSGKIELNGPIDNMAYSGEVLVDNIGLEASDGFKLESAGGLIKLEGTNAKTEHFKLAIADNIFDYSGSVSGLNGFGSSKQKFLVAGSVHTSKLDLNSLLTDDEAEGEVNGMFPSNVNAEIKLTVDTARYNKLMLYSLNSRIKLRNKQLYISEFRSTGLNGSVSGDFIFTEREDFSYVMDGQSILSDIDIHELFYSFSNFGQDYITSEHLMGDLTGTVSFSGEFDGNFSLVSDELYMESSFTIFNGELYDFEPLQELSNFIDVSEIDHIKFSELSNDIVVQESKLFFPKMKIESNLLNLKVAGIHGFDESYSYKLELLLSEILSKKARVQNRTNLDYDPFDEASGRSRLFLKMEGNAHDSKISYDRDALKTVRKQNRKDEKQELKMILNEEFGLFKKDSASFKKIKKQQDERKNKKVRIVWDEDDPEESDNTD